MVLQDLVVTRKTGSTSPWSEREVPERNLPSRMEVPGARVMWLDEPQLCPTYPGIALRGVAVAPDGQRHYLVLSVRPRSKPAFLLHMGPDPDALSRIGLIMAVALQTYGGELNSSVAGAALLAWLAACWTELGREVDAAAAAVPAQAQAILP